MIFLGKNIRYLRKRSSKTQTEIALLIRKGQTTIGNWENGISEPSIEELLAISNYFDISVDILLKIDLSQTNWSAGAETKNEIREIGDRKENSAPNVAGGRKTGHSPMPVVDYDHTNGGLSLVREAGEEYPSMTYLLGEIKSLREEMERIHSRLPADG